VVEASNGIVRVSGQYKRVVLVTKEGAVEQGKARGVVHDSSEDAGHVGRRYLGHVELVGHDKCYTRGSDAFLSNWTRADFVGEWAPRGQCVLSPASFVMEIS
jgi:hypothetical protein